MRYDKLSIWEALKRYSIVKIVDEDSVRMPALELVFDSPPGGGGGDLETYYTTPSASRV